MEYRHGALYVIEEARGHDSILHELKQLDPRIFLERQLTYDNSAVWCVVVDVGLDHPPITILEWRDSKGNPLPELSSGIVARVAGMERDADRLSDKVMKANQAFIAEKRKRTHDWYEDIGRDGEDRASGKRSPVFHRGQHLRISRDKMRAKGRNV